MATKRKETQDIQLTPVQENVIAELLAGKTQTDAAAGVGIRPEQISRWKSDDNLFVAVLNQRTVELWESNRAELLALARDARTALRDLLTSDNDSVRLRAAVAVLNAQNAPGDLPTTSEAVKEERFADGLFNFTFGR